MKRFLRRWVLPLGILCGMLGSLLLPELSAGGISDGLLLCCRTVIPALFPYLVLSALFVQTGAAERLGRRLGTALPKLFGISAAGAAPILLGAVGGYPIGARTIAELYADRRISREDADRLLRFACNGGPSFFFGVIARFFGSPAVGACLFGIHLVSALLVGLFFSGKPAAKAPSLPSETHGASACSVTDAVAQAVPTMLKLCGFILFFSWLLSFLRNFIGGTPYVLTAGFSELCSGIRAIAESALTWRLKFILTAGFMGWGGLCVLGQTAGILRESRLSPKPYIQGKLLHGLLSAALAWPVSYGLEPARTAAVTMPVRLAWSPWPWSFFCFAMILLIFLQYSTGNFAEHRI